MALFDVNPTKSPRPPSLESITASHVANNNRIVTILPAVN